MDLAHNNPPPAGVVDGALKQMPCAFLVYSLDVNAAPEIVEISREKVVGQVPIS